MDNEKDMLEALIQHQAYLHRLSTGAVNELIEKFVKESNAFASKLRELLDELTDSEKNALVMGSYTTDALKDIRSAFSDFYSTMVVVLPETFAASAIALATYESMFTSKLYGKEIELDGKKTFNKSKKVPVFGGQLFDEVWRNLAADTREKALYAMRQGIVQGLTTPEIVALIKGKRTKMADGSYEYVGGIVDQTKNHIDANVRTIRSHVGNIAMVETFDALGYEYLKFVSVLDGRTTKGCAVLDQTVWKKGDSNIVYPPRHYRCRSMLIGVDKDGKVDGERPFVMDNRPVKDIPKGERVGKIGQVDANKSFADFFKTADVSFQKEWLGEKRYKLYTEGKFPLSKFIDPLGNQYTLKELKALDAAIFKRLGL